MGLPRKLATATVLMLFASLANAALIFDWEFTVVGPSFSPPPPPIIISGTIAGLIEGVNDGSGLSIFLNPTPDGEVLDQNWMFNTAFTGPAFTVTAGEVTRADALFSNTDGDALYFGTNPFNNGGDSWAPELVIASSGERYHSCDIGSADLTCGINRFTLGADVPIPSTLLLLGLTLLGLVHTKRLRQH